MLLLTKHETNLSILPGFNLPSLLMSAYLYFPNNFKDIKDHIVTRKQSLKSILSHKNNFDKK